MEDSADPKALPFALSTKSLKHRAAVYAAGPVANFLFAAAIICISLVIFGERALMLEAESPIGLRFILAGVSGFSILVGLFNLAPIAPLDGGWIVLFAYQAFKGKPLDKSIQRRICRLRRCIDYFCHLYFFNSSGGAGYGCARPTLHFRVHAC